MSIHGPLVTLLLFLLLPQVLSLKRVPHHILPCVLFTVEMMPFLVHILLQIKMGFLTCDLLVIAVSD